MKIGVDSSVIVAGVHANHPRHAAAAQWLVQAMTVHELMVCHHSVLESYAVLTSLPGDLRVTPSEARDLLEATVRANMVVAEFQPESIWSILESFVPLTTVGGRSYDAFTARVLHASGTRVISTLNPKHFSGLIEGLKVITPGEIGGA